MQTNAPGRCVSLYGGLLWLSERHGLPIRLLEIGGGFERRRERSGTGADSEARLLAHAGYHGPPVVWRDV